LGEADKIELYWIQISGSECGKQDSSLSKKKHLCCTRAQFGVLFHPAAAGAKKPGRGGGPSGKAGHHAERIQQSHLSDLRMQCPIPRGAGVVAASGAHGELCSEDHGPPLLYLAPPLPPPHFAILLGQASLQIIGNGMVRWT